MLRLTIEAVNADELYQHVRELYEGFAPQMTITGDTLSLRVDPAQRTLPADEPVEAVQEPFVAEPEEEPTPEPEAPQEAKDEPQGPTAEEVRTVLNELRKSKGSAAVKEILKAHGAENFPGLDKAHYAAVMKEAQENG